MRGQNINVYLPYDTFVKIESLIKERKISAFINQAILREVKEQEKKEKEIFEKSMINSYKRVASNQEIQSDAKI
jgi:hypothetical protein